MAESLYIASMEPGSGKSVVALGVMELLSRRLERVGYFRPVIPSGKRRDGRISLISERYKLDFDDHELYAYTDDEVQQLLAEGRVDEVFKGVLEVYHRLADQCEFVLCDGTDYTGVSAALEFDFNAQVANHLGAPVLSLVNGAEKRGDEVVSAVKVARESLAAEGCTLAVTIVNRVAEEAIEPVREALESSLPEDEPLYILPEEPLLGRPTMAEVAEALDAQVLRGEPADAEREITSYRVAAMSLTNFLDRLDEGVLVIAPGDRPAMILGALAAQLSSSYPSIAGLVLTGGFAPDEQILRLIDGFVGTPPPVLLVDTDTYITARDLTHLHAAIRPENDRKVAAALGLFEQHIDTAELENRIVRARSERVTPLMFEYELIERAKADRQHIVLPEGTDPRILQAAELLTRRGVADLTLLGNEEEIQRELTGLGLDLDVPVIDPAASPLHKTLAAEYYKLRQHKGVSQAFADDVVRDVGYFGTLMVHLGYADGMVSGAAHTTAHTIRPAFEIIKTKPGVKSVSSVFLMCLPDRVLVYGDCAVNPDPDAEQLADIAITSAETAQMFGVEPRVAMLSYSTGESGQGAAVEKVRQATRQAQERRPDLSIDGPIQYDAAVDASVAKAKMPDSAVAGHATVFVFPDLNTGNNTYKAVQRSSGAVAIGPVLQGLNKPVNDLSRGCLVADIVNTVAITAVQAQAAE